MRTQVSTIMRKNVSKKEIMIAKEEKKKLGKGRMKKDEGKGGTKGGTSRKKKTERSRKKRRKLLKYTHFATK